MLLVQGVGMQTALLILDGRLYELEDRLQGVFLLRTVQFITVDDRLGGIIGRPPGRPATSA